MRNKKVLTMLLVACLAASSLIACGDKKATNTTTEQTQVQSETLYSPAVGDKKVDIADYSKVDISDIKKYTVTDEDIQNEIDYILQYYSNSNYIDEGEVKDDSIVYVSYDAMLNGEKVDEASSTGMELTIGSGYMPGDFESQLVGHQVGDELEISYTFPEDDASHGGETFIFKTKIEHLVEPVEAVWNDEFVVKNLEYASTSEYEKFLRTDMQTYYDSLYDQEISERIISYLVDNSKVDGLTDDEINTYMQEGIEYYTSYAKSSEMELEEFVKTNMGYEKYEDFEKDLKDQAKRDLEYKYITLAIASRDKIVLTQVDYDNYIKNMAEYYSSDIETVKTQLEEDGKIPEDVLSSALCAKVIDNISAELIKNVPTSDAKEDTDKTIKEETNNDATETVKESTENK